MALPFLPGFSANTQLGKERFHKSQHFIVSSGLPMLAGSEKPGIGGEGSVGQRSPLKYSEYPRVEGSDLPSWVLFDKQVLCFEAYFQETVPVAELESHRIRKCKIYFYLEDDTIQVVEPRCKNSGLPQGTLISRQRIPLPPPKHDHFYNVFHFNINQEMAFYSRTFTVTDCDQFTKNFLTKLGVQLNRPAVAPEDSYSILRQQHEESMKPLRPYERHDTFKQFLDYDGKILRFHCLWDDTENTFGDQRELILHYYLADDTIEVFEVTPPNCGREHVPKFLRRSKLPKHTPVQKQPGEVVDRTVLNVFSSKTQGERSLLDSKTGGDSQEFYSDSDLAVGGELNIWGRRVILTDCDEFTRQYYRSKYGVEDFSPVQYKVPPAPRPARPPPPYNGFGSEEDSLGSCLGVLPRPPKKDFRKFMEKDRWGLNSNVLSFRAKMTTKDPVDQERAFIISFYLSDDSMSVFERPQRNSGVLGGKFLERRRVRKPGQDPFRSEPSEYFTAQDLYVGASVCLNGVTFQLLEADDYTLDYMEQHADEFHRANTGSILSKLQSIPESKQREVRKFLTLSDPSSSGCIPYESFRSLLMGLDCGLSEHEVLVLARCGAERQQPAADLGLMLAVAQDLLRKKYFQDFHRLEAAFTYHDRLRLGRLSTAEVRTICRAFPLPLPESLRESVLSQFADGDEIDYHALVAGINWLERPAPPVTAEDALKFQVNARLEDDGTSLRNISYSVLLELFGALPLSGDPAAPEELGSGSNTPRRV